MRQATINLVLPSVVFRQKTRRFQRSSEHIMPNKSKTVSQVQLYLEILKLIPRHRWISQTEIRQALELRGIAVTELTLQRTLKALREAEDLHIECDTRSKPYGYRTGVENAFTQAKLTVQESLLLRLVQEHLIHQLPGSLCKALTPLFDSARRVLDDKADTGRANAWLAKVAVLPNSLPFMPPLIKPRIFNTVSDALYGGRKLEIVYGSDSLKARKHVVSPLGLVQQDVRLYLVCLYDGYDDIRHLALHRIKSADMLERPADVPEGFSLSAYLKSVPFNYTFTDSCPIRLSFEITNPDSVSNLRETPFNPSQRITEKEEGVWTVEVDIIDSLLLDGWLATWKDISGIRNVVKTPVSSEDMRSKPVCC